MRASLSLLCGVLTVSMGCSTSEEPSASRDAGATQDAGPGLDASVEPDAGDQNIEPTDGFKTLYIGHSFGRPFAEKVPQLAERVGIPNHRQEIVFSGGASGAPMALWQDDEDRNAAQAILDGGDIDVLVMICCSEGWMETAEDQGIVNWIDYALEQNPNTRFALAFPWPDFPERYDSASFSSLWDQGYTMWKQTIDAMRSRYDGIEIFSIPHGRASTQLWTLFEAGELPEVSSLRGPRASSIFTDEKGHAGDIFKNMGATIWVGAIYGVDVSEMTYGVAYETDIAGMAQAIVAADDYTRTP